MSEVKWEMYIWYKTLAILLSTYQIIKIDGHLTKFWHKQFVQFILRHGVYRSNSAQLDDLFL